MNIIGFDFLSSAPRSFIFQRKSNQTNFGGVLSLLYLLIFIIISSFYLFSYFNEDNYSIQYLYQEKFITQEEILKRVESDRYNPKFNICFDIQVKAEKEIADRFQVRRYNNILYSEVNKSVCQNIRFTDLNWLVVYDCLNRTECKILIFYIQKLLLLIWNIMDFFWIIKIKLLLYIEIKKLFLIVIYLILKYLILLEGYIHGQQ